MSAMERKPSFSFGTLCMDVGTPNFAQGFVQSPFQSPVKAVIQPEAALPGAAACCESARKMNPWQDAASAEELFCLEELVTFNLILSRQLIEL